MFALNSLKKKALNLNRSTTVCRGEREDKKKKRKKNIKETVIKCPISRSDPILKRY